MSIIDFLEMKKKQARVQRIKKTAKKVAIGAAAGAVAGVIAGVLFAPGSGKDTRARIATGAKKAVAAVKQKVKEKAASSAQA